MAQHRITEAGPLLDAAGHLREKGYATSLLLAYDRATVKAHPLRIKEWDYYLVLCDDYAVALTIADNAYMGLDSLSLLDFRKPWQQTVSKMRILPRGKTGLPASSAQGDASIAGNGYALSFAHQGKDRVLTFSMERFYEGEAISGEIRLTEEPEDSIAVATPFHGKPKAFYYNQKINCMRAEGTVKLGGNEYPFSPENSFGTLDWGRGVWTYDNTWYWGSASGLVDGVPFGFNIGCGFGDTSAASENVLFYDGKAHKLDQVDFGIPRCGGRDVFMNTWHLTSNDDRLRLDFEPILDRESLTSIGVIYSDQHQVFGRFSGQVVLDDGRALSIERMMGFAEKVSNKW